MAAKRRGEKVCPFKKEEGAGAPRRAPAIPRGEAIAMARWDILRQNQVRDGELQPPHMEPREELKDSNTQVSRGPADESSTNGVERPERSGNAIVSRTPSRRAQHRDRDRTYSLRSSEIATMTDVGMFRTVDVRDLARFVYGGDEARLKYDLVSLRAQGLVEEKTVFRAHPSPPQQVTLTPHAQRLPRRATRLPPPH